MKKLQPQQIGLLIVTAAMLVLWIIPGGQLATLPLQYLDTHLHETCHAIASLLTAGSVGTIHVYADGSGVTQTYMDHPVIVASAGYVGSSIIGAGIIAVSRSPKGARIAMLGVFGLLMIECMFWLRGDLTGMISGFVYMLAFLVMGIKLDGWTAMIVAQFIGLQQCLTSLQAVFGLVNPRILSYGDNDATILQGITHVPAILWSASWSLFSLIVVVIAFGSAWSASANRRPRSPVVLP
ncbi:MAG TPA: M50 family metallopeptidase [Fimbriimonadaceae bacterium]